MKAQQIILKFHMVTGLNSSVVEQIPSIFFCKNFCFDPSFDFAYF